MSADRKHPADIIFDRHPESAEILEKHRLTDRDLRFVVRAVHDVVDKWEGIALCLKVKSIDKIKRDYKGAERRMIAVLSAWLREQTREGKAPNLSWKSVVQVVADHAGGKDVAHAEHILLHYSKLSKYTPSKMATHVSNSPFVPAGASKEDIKSKATDLQKELEEVSPRWYQLGVLLGLPVHILDGYQDNYDELSEWLHAILQEWLKNGNTGEYEIPSRQVLVNAVEDSAGGENARLARELADSISPLHISATNAPDTANTAAGSGSSSSQATKHYLSITDLKVVNREVWDAREEYTRLAIELDLPHSLIFQLRRMNPAVALTKVLDMWLRGSFTLWRSKDYPSWEILITALKQPTVGHQELAARLVKYLKAVPASDPSVEATASATCFPRVSDKPKLHEFQVLGNIRLIDLLAHKWKELAIALHLNGSTIKQIRQDNPDVLKDACIEVLDYWLSGESACDTREPKQWATVLQALNDIQKTDLARELRAKLRD